MSHGWRLGPSSRQPKARTAPLAPELEAARYFTYVVLILLMAGWTLLMLVFAQRRPASA